MCFHLIVLLSDLYVFHFIVFMFYLYVLCFLLILCNVSSSFVHICNKSYPGSWFSDFGDAFSFRCIDVWFSCTVVPEWLFMLIPDWFSRSVFNWCHVASRLIYWILRMCFHLIVLLSDLYVLWFRVVLLLAPIFLIVICFSSVLSLIACFDFGCGYWCVCDCCFSLFLCAHMLFSMSIGVDACMKVN